MNAGAVTRRRIRLSLGLGLALAALAAPGSVASSDPACIVYSYDGTGNRLSETTASVTAPTWGTATWGCFLWTAQ